MTPGSRHPTAKSTQRLLLARRVNFLVGIKLCVFTSGKLRPYGGLGILWRKSLGHSCNVKPLDDPRLLLLEITFNNEQCLSLLNVYLPYDDGSNLDGSNLDEYQMYLAKVSTYLDGNYSAAFGDFNGNIISNNHRFGKELVQFCENESLVMSDYITGDKKHVYILQ